MKERKKVLIIGGGASGMLAAIVAAKNGAQVTILEQMQRVGKKLLATGNGRCNISNSAASLDRYHGQNVGFAEYALTEFDAARTIGLFEDMGLSLRQEDGGKLFPFSGQASSVLDILRYELDRVGVTVMCEAEVKQIISKKGEFTVILKDGSKLTGHRVILAAGGRANANLGSTGTAYKLATDLGHKVTDTFPALVQLKLNGNHLKALAGVKFDGEASILADGKVIKKEAGEILFTDYGISGPPILQLSRSAAESLGRTREVYIRVDMFPEYSKEQLTTMLQRKLAVDPEKPLDFCLIGFINKKLIPILLKVAGTDDIHKPSAEVQSRELQQIIERMKGWEFQIIGTQPWRDAQVTAGGIVVDEVNPHTMESRLVPGLYLCGEILDIDGDCGGFNLQWAWSSGFLAGRQASR